MSIILRSLAFAIGTLSGVSAQLVVIRPVVDWMRYSGSPCGSTTQTQPRPGLEIYSRAGHTGWHPGEALRLRDRRIARTRKEFGTF